ncbi:MAG: YqiA/YcfP family alpha/beta fold hydrolase [Gemmatimonadota bacterium]
MILYLHGFRSSPGSKKAIQLRDSLVARGRGSEFVCPQLPVSPSAAIRTARAAIEARSMAQGATDLCLIGSSLGGYYATWLAEQIGCRTVLLNPAIRPYDDLRGHLGQQPVYFSSETIEMRPEYLDELLVLETPRITRPDQYLLIAATGDELIDYRTMVAKYAGCNQHIIDGSDHSLSDFGRYLEEVLAFCGVS